MPRRTPQRHRMLLGLIVGLCLPLLSPAHPIGIHAEKPQATRSSRRPGVAPPPATGPALLWRTAPATRPLLTTPAVGPDGTVYAATDDGTLYALAPDGHTLWMLHTAITTRLAPPAVGPDETSYWSLPGGVMAVTAQGQVAWVFLVVHAGRPVVDGNRVLVATDSYLESIGAQGANAGHLLWRAALGADHTTGVGPAPAVASDGTAYVATAGGDLDAIGVDGQRRWRARLGLPLLFRPAVGSDGTIYVSTYIQGRGLVFAVTPQGTLRWERAVTAGSDVAVGADGTIYLAARDVVALTPRGQVRWHRVVGTTAPPVALDGGVAVSQLSPPALVAFDASGAVRWQTPLPRPLTGPPALGPAGRLYGADVTASVLALATGVHGAGRVLPLKASAGPPVNPGANDPPFYVQRGAVAWRVTLAQTVERRVGNGAWQTVLTPGRPGVDAATGRVIPELYGSIRFLALDPHDSGLYVGTEGVLGNYQLGGQGGATGGLYYSPDGIGHWESRSSGLPYTYEPRLHVPTYGIASLTIDSKQRGHLFAQISPDFGAPGLDAGLYISQDGGLHWAAGNHGLQAESRGNGLLGFYNAYPPGELLIDPTRPWILYLVAPTGLYRSPDRGLHWGRVAGVTYDDPTTVAVRLSTRGAASAFTDQGQFASSDYGEHWRLVRSYQIPTVQFPVSGAPFYAPPPTPVPPTPAARARSTATEVAPATGTAAASQQQIGASPLWPLMKARIGPSMTLPRGRIAVALASLSGAPDFEAPADVTATLSATATTPTDTATSASTATVTSSTTATVSATVSATSSVTVSATATATGSPMATITPTTSITASATITATPTPVVTATQATTATATPTQAPNTAAPALPTATPTNTPIPTATATATPPPVTTELPAAWTWTQLIPNGASGSPPRRQDATAVWDPVDRELLYYGGTNSRSSTAVGELWAYSPAAGTWRHLISSNAAPPGRFGAAGVWDPVGKRLLIFGGQQSTGLHAGLLNDVVAYAPSSNSWSTLSRQGAPGAPSPRSHVAATWDPSTGRLLVFGGETSDAPLALSSQLWAFSPGSPGTWTLLAGGGGRSQPPARQSAALVWDASSDVVRLYGGKNGASSPLGDMWQWNNGSGWTFTETRAQPRSRAALAATWDVQHSHWLVGPGLGLDGDTRDLWAYDPAAKVWDQQAVSGPAPQPRQMGLLVWDDADGQGLLIGGRVAKIGTANDLWALRPATTPAAPPPAAPWPAIRQAVDVGLLMNGDGTLAVTPRMVQAVKDAGATMVRFAFHLGPHTGWSPALLQDYGRVITMFGKAGIGVIGLVGSGATTDTVQADWTANSYELTGGSGDNPVISAIYTANLRTLVRYFHGPPYNVKIWELWNEPNAYTSCAGIQCGGASFMYPSNFAALLADSYTAIKVADRIGDVTLLSGGIFGHSIGGAYTPENAGATYLSATYHIGVDVIGSWKAIKAETGSYPLDAVGQHIYVDQTSFSVASTIQAYEDWVRRAYTAYEGAATKKPTIITEEGWATGSEPGIASVSLEQQLDNVDAAYWAAKAVTYVPMLTWFRLRDNPEAHLFQGLYTPDWAPKPAEARYQAQRDWRRVP